MTAGLASVVIPAYNEELFLAEAIDSVLAQTYEPVEIVVVDDGSTDRTADIASSYGEVILVRQGNRGLAATRNVGFAATSGEFVAFHDADDLMTPDKLAIQIGVLNTDPDCGCVLAYQRLIVEEGATMPFWARLETLPLSPAGAEGEPPPAPHTGTLVMRRETFGVVGPFDESMRRGEDLDWVFRLHESGTGTRIVDDVLLVRRIHNASLTQDTEASRKALFIAFKKRVERHRGAGHRSSS